MIFAYCIFDIDFDIAIIFTGRPVALLSSYLGITNLYISLLPHWHKKLLFKNYGIQRGRRGQMSIVFACGVGHSNIPGSIPGPTCWKTQRPIYPDCACRLQWATIRCGKHVHAGYMSYNMKSISNLMSFKRINEKK